MTVERRTMKRVAVQPSMHTFAPTALIVLATALATAGHAADEAAQPGTVPNQPIETINVTGQRLNYLVTETDVATKTPTPIMQTPVSIQVVPQQVLRDQQVVRLEQAVKNVSGVYTNNIFFGQFADEFTIRGFRNAETIFRDGFRMDSLSGKYDMTNVEQVEVIKGPTSVLYGRLEPGGMVNYVTKKPLSQPSYAIEQQVGSFNMLRTTVDATGPMDEAGTLLYRFDAGYEDSESFRQFVDADRRIAAPSLLWKIGADTELLLQYEYFDNHSTPDNIGGIAFGDRPLDLPDNRNLAEPTDFIDAEKHSTSATLTHAFSSEWRGDLRFDYIDNHEKDGGAYGDYVDDAAILADLLPRTIEGSQTGLGETVDQTAYSTALNLTGRFDALGARHTVLVGADYRSADTDAVCCGIRGQLLSDISISQPAHRVTLGPIEFVDYSGSNREQWQGYYAQDQLELQGHVHVLLGVRYDIIDNRDRLNHTLSGDDGATPRIGILWQPIDSMSLYASYVENFGASNSGSVDSNGDQLDPETADQWEIGVKSEFLEGRLITTLAAFDLTKKNIAADNTATIDPNDAIAIGEAESKGIELDVTGQVAPGWNVIVAYAYTQTRIVDDAFIGIAGNEFANVPKNGGRVWSTYTFEESALRGLTIGGGVTSRGSRQGNLSNDFELPGYATFDLMAAYSFQFGPSHLTAQLNVNNMFDRSYYEASADFGRDRIMYGEPRAFVGSLRAEF